MCCLTAFASLVCWRSTCQLQGPLDSGVAFYFKVLLSLQVQTPPNSMSSPSGQCLLVVSAVGCVAVLMQVHLRWFSPGDEDRAHWCRPGTGWQQTGRQRIHATGFPWHWFVQPSHLSLQSRCSQMSPRAGCLSEIQPAGWGWTVESNSVTQWGLMQALQPLSCTVI